MHKAEILPVASLDHYSISSNFQANVTLVRCPFKFEKMWLRVEGFKDLVSGWWNSALVRNGNKAYIFFKKLQFLKECLKRWNQKSFRNIFVEKLKLEETLRNLCFKNIEEGMTYQDFV